MSNESRKRTHRDNPNSKANIAIVLPPFFFFIDAFKSVIDNLPNAEFVPDFTQGIRQGVNSDEYRNALRNRLIQENVYWRDLEYSGLQPAEFFDKYAVLVTPFYGGLTSKPYNRQKRKARVFYGTAKDSWSYGLSNAYFDLILCPGRYAEERLSQYSGRVVAIGEPKHDPLHSRTQEKSEIARTSNLTLDVSKQTILYMPTWGALSSLRYSMPALVSLTDNYNVIVKLHHVTALTEEEEIEKFRSSSLVILNKEVSMPDAVSMADVVISDNSSSIFDALAAGKRLVMIDPIVSKDTYFAETPFFGSVDGRLMGVGTHVDSIEQVIKRPGREIAPVVKLKSQQSVVSEVELRGAIRDANDPVYSDRQINILDRLFSYRDGLSGKRAAEEITKLLYDAGDHERDKTLERYVEEYYRRIRSEVASEMFFKEVEKIQQLEKFESLKRLPYFAKLRAIFTEFF